MTFLSGPYNLLEAFVVLLFTRWIYIRVTRRLVLPISGPATSDWLLGNLTDLSFEEAGTPQFSWQKQFGLAFKIHGFLGGEYLMISDPKALQHVYSDSNSFGRRRQSRDFMRLLFGPGLLTVDGDDHKRQRRVMQPAFGTGNLKALFPVFMRHSQKLLSVINKEVESHSRGESRSATIDVYNYMARATLDIIGDAAFDYEIGSLDGKVNPLRDAFHELELKSWGKTTKISLLLQVGFQHLPFWMLELVTYLPINKLSQMRKTRNTIATISERLVQRKVDTYTRGLEGEKDLLSLLVRANAVEEPRWKLSDSEVNAEIATILGAGYVTTSSTLAFGLWELAKNPAMQARIREEILDMKRQAKEHGETEIDIQQYENMPLLVAFINEVLRYHSVAYLGDRVATQDSVIPLSRPLALTSGQVVNEIPVTKGQLILTDIAGYHRLSEIFGTDSDEFNMDRWLDGKLDEKRSYSHVGIYASLMTFGHGPHACIGWRFSLYETQCLLIDLLSTFKFNLANDGKHVFRAPVGAMVPNVREDRAAGPALYLDVSILQD